MVVHKEEKKTKLFQNELKKYSCLQAINMSGGFECYVSIEDLLVVERSNLFTKKKQHCTSNQV